MSTPKILILGHGQHGKDTAAAILSKEFGLSFASSSMFAMEQAVWPILSLTNRYKDMDECYADRSNHREVWRRLIKMYNTPDPALLTRGILAENDIYVGMRDLQEFEATRHLFSFILWVDASKRKPLEESMQIHYDAETMSRIDNNGSFAYMKHNLIDMFGSVLKGGAGLSEFL